MSRPQFLADHDLNERIILGVLRREPTVYFLRARAAGLEAAADPDVLRYAAKEGLIVVSHDVNTMTAAPSECLARGEPMSGLLMVHQTESLGSIIDDLVLIWLSSESEDWQNMISFLPIR